jgi:hypothetical protein
MSLQLENAPGFKLRTELVEYPFKLIVSIPELSKIHKTGYAFLLKSKILELKSVILDENP